MTLRMTLARVLQVALIGLDSFMTLLISVSVIFISLIMSLIMPILTMITPVQKVYIKGTKCKLSYMCSKKALDYRPNWTLLAKAVRNQHTLDMNLAELMMQLCTIIYNTDDQIVKEVIHQYELECDEVICGGKRTGTYVSYSVDNGVLIVVMRGKELLDTDSWLVELTPAKIRSDARVMPAGMVHQPSHNILQYSLISNATAAQTLRRRAVWEQDRSKLQHNPHEVLMSPTYHDSSATPRFTEALIWTIEEILRDEFGYSVADGRWLNRPSIWITGHGLGGTLSTLLLAHFATLKITSTAYKWLHAILGCYSFGGVRPGDSELADSMAKVLARADFSLYRLIAANDIMPYLPPSSNLIYNLFKATKKMQETRRNVDDGAVPQSMLDFSQPGQGIYLSYSGTIKNSMASRDIGKNFTNWMLENVITMVSLMYQGSPLNMFWSFMTGQTVTDILHAMIYRFFLYDSLPQSYLDRIRECTNVDSLTSYQVMPDRKRAPLHLYPSHHHDVSSRLPPIEKEGRVLSSVHTSPDRVLKWSFSQKRGV
ncbi:hypothetical protein SeMB42_g04884 [Synchytrium endobioticum]|uniref:Fungal lipase-type domain-containing protein n=1 Tax=Synchytrium endobioticum TaxID=286115 RepID=A0A507CV20_9FUNG|nr:hypothetical protein SeMB42_g04884 [Synchytrium endobioticum]